MNKKLPKVFANKIEKINKTNEVYNVSKNEEEIVKNNKNIYQKINDIFSSYRYVYKADVIITTNKGEFTKRIIGKKGDNLITFDNELINISNIIDIKYKE